MTNPNDIPVEEMVAIIYHGPEYSHNVASPTGELHKRYGLTNYGFYGAGDRFSVLKADADAAPEKFELVNPPAVTDAEADAAPKPLTATEKKKLLASAKKTEDEAANNPPAE